MAAHPMERLAAHSDPTRRCSRTIIHDRLYGVCGVRCIRVRGILMLILCSFRRHLRGGGLRFRPEAGHIPFPHYHFTAARTTQEDARHFQGFPGKIHERVLVALRNRSS